jgi:hypothetical protein
MEIAAWLRSLGLEQYEPPFRDNGIHPSAHDVERTSDDPLFSVRGVRPSHPRHR